MTLTPEKGLVVQIWLVKCNFHNLYSHRKSWCCYKKQTSAIEMRVQASIAFFIGLCKQCNIHTFVAHSHIFEIADITGKYWCDSGVPDLHQFT